MVEYLIKGSLYYISIPRLLASKCKNNKDDNEIAMNNEIQDNCGTARNRSHIVFPHIITFM